MLFLRFYVPDAQAGGLALDSDSTYEIAQRSAADALGNVRSPAGAQEFKVFAGQGAIRAILRRKLGVRASRRLARSCFKMPIRFCMTYLLLLLFCGSSSVAHIMELHTLGLKKALAQKTGRQHYKRGTPPKRK